MKFRLLDSERGPRPVLVGLGPLRLVFPVRLLNPLLPRPAPLVREPPLFPPKKLSPLPLKPLPPSLLLLLVPLLEELDAPEPRRLKPVFVREFRLAEVPARDPA